MPTFNFKLAIILVVGTGLLAGSTHLLNTYQVYRHSSAYRTAAIAAWDEEPRRDRDAIQFMTRYLSLRPNDWESHQVFGGWLAETGRFGSAAAELETVVRIFEKRDPSEQSLKQTQDVRRKLVEVYLSMGRCADAEAHLKILSQELPDDADVFNLLGKCHVTLGREKEALAEFSRAIALKPDRIDIYYNKAMTLRFPPVQKPEEAQKCMVEMVSYRNDQGVDNSKNPNAHHVYGVWLTEFNDFAGALQQAETTLQLKADHPGGLYLAGHCELQVGRRAKPELQRLHYAKAKDYARRGKEAAPQDFAMYTLMADILMNDNRREEAIAVLREGIETIIEKSVKAKIYWHLANLYLDDRKSVDSKAVLEAVDCIERLREIGFSPIQLQFLSTRVLYANDDWKSALAGFEEVRPSLTGFPQLMKCLDYWIGYCYLQQGNPDQAMTAFRRALSFDKFYFKAHDGIAQIFAANSRLKDAAEEYQQAVIGNPGDINAWLSLGRTLVLYNLRRKASDDDWAQVWRILQQAEVVEPANGQIQLLKAEILVARGDMKNAEGLLTSLQGEMPKGVEYYVALANLAARRGDRAKATEILDNAEKKLGDQVLIRLARAVLAIRAQWLRAGPEIDRLAAGADGFHVEERVRLWAGLMNNFCEIREYDRAKQLCRQIAAIQPRDATIRYRLLELELLTHNYRDPSRSFAEMDKLLDEIENLAGQGPLWMYGKAVRLKLEAGQDKADLADPAKAKMLDDAMDYAAQAQRMRLAWSRPYVLKGEICRHRGDSDQALQHYLQASILGDRDLDFIRLLLQMLFERQRYQEADQVIRRLDNNQTQFDPGIEQAKAQFFAIWGSFDRALECAEKAYDPNSDDYHEHIWHGQVLKVLARRALLEGHRDRLAEIVDKAEKSLRAAIQLAPNAAEARVELVQLLITANQPDRARVAARDAEEMIALDVAPLAMGYIHEAVGDRQKAGASYEKAMQRNPGMAAPVRMLADFYVRTNDPKRAEPLVERLLGPELKPSEFDLCSARRMKAMLLARQGYPRFKEAIGLLNQNLGSPLAATEDKRLKARILLADPGRMHGSEALEIMEGLVATGGAEPDPQDRFDLARLHLARDNWDRCREQMEKLVNSGLCDPRYIEAYVGMLIRQDQLTDADLWLSRLEQVGKPGAAVATRAELMFRRKEWGQIPDFLAAYVKMSNAVPEDRLDRTLVAAQLLENFGKRLNAAAERAVSQGFLAKSREWFEDYSRNRAGSDMTLASFHARCGRVAEALALLEQSGAKSQPGELAVAVVAVSRCEKITADELSRIDKLVQDVLAAQKDKEPAILLSARAVVKITQNQFAEAEQIYRQVIARDPENAIAYNNLGVLLTMAGKDLDEALNLTNRAIDLVGPLPFLLDSRAVVFIARNEPQRALRDLDAIVSDETDPVWLFHRARAYAAADRAEDAAAALAEARNRGLERVTIDPPERPIYDAFLKELKSDSQK